MADMALIVTAKGFGKLVSPDEYPTRGRGGKGVIGYKVTEESGPVVGVAHVQTGIGQRVLITTAQGMSLMTEVDGISVRSRAAGGVKIMNVEDGDAVVSVSV
jgi:DNA gyrase subunit A